MIQRGKWMLAGNEVHYIGKPYCKANPFRIHKEELKKTEYAKYLRAHKPWFKGNEKEFLEILYWALDE